MTMNYDASQVGVPYVRAHYLEIHYPDNGIPPWATIKQSMGVKLADGTIRRLDDPLPLLVQSFDLTDQTPIPLVSPDTGAPLGPTVTLGQVMLSLLAVVRKVQTGGFIETPPMPETPLPPEEP